MLVGERMSHPVIFIHSDMPVNEALHLMRTEHIRRIPVIDNNKLVGIVSMKDLLNASPSPATSLSVWELNYLLSKLTVGPIMTRKVLNVTEDTPIEEAARIMADNRIGGVPVMRDSHVVGMITETDLFKIFLELMGARDRGIRVTLTIPDVPGQLAKLSQVVANAGGNIIALGTFASKDTTEKQITFKVAGMTLDQVREQITPIVHQIIDLRESHP